jgi:hypothetical protein
MRYSGNAEPLGGKDGGMRRRRQDVGRIADAIVAACEAWPTVNGYVPCHYKQGCGCEMVPARVRAAIAALGQVTAPAPPAETHYMTPNEQRIMDKALRRSTRQVAQAPPGGGAYFGDVNDDRT